MPSPFKTLPNATLLFEITGTTTTTDEFGNVTDVEGSLSVTAYLKQQQLGKIPRVNVPGMRQDATYYIGWSINPQTLPATVRQGNWATCTMGTTTGQFYLRELLNPPFGRTGIGAVLESAIGTRIEGWFQTEGY